MVAGVCAVLAGCSPFATPTPAPVHNSSSLAPPGPLGYVVCSDAVSPVELDTATAELPIPLPVRGTPPLGDYAIATTSNGQWAYVDTTDADPGRNVVIPVNLVTQEAETPIDIPGQGDTHAIVVLPGGQTVVAASGDTLVPVDTATRQVGRPLDLGPGRIVFGMALDPVGTTLYVLVPGGIVPVDTADAVAGPIIPTGLAVSSVSSPHGITITPNGSTLYVVGQGGTDFGGRVLPIATATATLLPATGFDKYGIADPAAVAVSGDGSLLLVVDSANDWINPVPLASFSNPPAPVHLPPALPGTSTAAGHPTDIVIGPAGSGAFVVDGFDAVVPYQPASETFGHPVAVCSGASSMAVAPAP